MTTYRTNDPSRWGNGVGRDLTATEIDLNFYGHETRIAALETSQPTPDSIANIGVSGTNMTVTLESGTVFGPFPLPVLMFRWRGQWQPNTSYSQLDTFQVPLVGLYTVLIAHTSPAAFNGAYLDPVSGQPVYNQLFGFSGLSLHVSDLLDVQLTGLASGQILEWNGSAWVNINPASVSGVASLTDVKLMLPLADKQILRYVLADARWENVLLGTMADQAASAVAITGGAITGLGTPTHASDAATKAYVDGVAASGVPSIINGTVLGNATGSPATAAQTTVSALLDAALGNAQGEIIFRSGTGWVVLAPGTAGNFLQTGGAGSNPVWAAPAGTGTVTSITTGAGLSGGTITTSGTIALGTVADADLLANTSGSTATPVATTLSALLDYVLSSNRGAVIYRGASGWAALSPGTSGRYLMTQGPGADPVWNSPAGAGTVTSITAGSGLSGGTITASGTIALANVNDGDVLANTSGVAAPPSDTTLTALLDHVFGNGQGGILYRGASAWSFLAHGTSGQVLQSGGASANPSWANSTSASLAGDSDVSITSVADKDQLIYSSSAGKWQNQRARYILGAFAPGLPTSSQHILYHKFTKAVTFPANFGAYLGHTSEAGGTVNATGNPVFNIDKASSGTPNTFSNVGTITIGTGTVTPTFASSGGTTVSFSQGDVLRIVAPASADSTFADFYASLVGYET